MKVKDKDITETPWFKIVFWVTIYLVVIGIYKLIVWLIDYHPQIFDFIIGAPHGEWQ